MTLSVIQPNVTSKSLRIVDKSRSISLWVFFGLVPISLSGGTLGMILLYCCSLYYWFKFPTQKPHIIFYIWAAFIASHLLSNLWAQADVIPMFKDLKQLWLLFLPFCIYSFFVNPKHKILPYLQVYLIVLSLHATYAILQFFYGFDWFIEGQQSTLKLNPNWHAQGLFNHHLTFGDAMLLAAPVTWVLCTANNLNTGLRISYSLSAILVSLAAVLSLGRSIWLGLLVSGLVFLWLFRKRRWVKIGLVVFAGSVGLVLLSTPQITTALYKRTSELFATKNTFEFGEINRRAFMTKAGLKVIQQHPFIGVGSVSEEEIGLAFALVEMEVLQHKFLNHTTTTHLGYPVFLNSPGVGVHNWYVQLGLEQGMLGLLLYLLAWGVLFLQSWRAVRSLKGESIFASDLLKALWVALLGFFVVSCFENNFLDDEVQSVALAWMGLCLALNHRITQLGGSSTGKLPQQT